MSRKVGRRVTLRVRRAKANTLIKTWISSLLNDAREANSKLTPMLEQALDSVCKYPVPLKSVDDCMMLKGFGRKLCGFLSKCLESHNSALEDGASSMDSETESNLDPTRSDTPLSSSSDSSMVPFNKYLPHNNEAVSTSQSMKNSAGQNIQANDEPAAIETPISDVESINGEVSESNCYSPKVSPTTSKKGRKKIKQYKPAYRSGGYAIMVTLLEHALENPEKPVLTKQKLIEKAQTHSDESFLRPKPDTYYTAWSNMNRLMTKGLVKKTGNKKVAYLLTTKGKKLARELLNESVNRVTTNDIIFNNASSLSSGGTDQNFNEIKVDEVPFSSLDMKGVVIEFEPGSFDIILLIDKNEIGGLRKKNDPTVAEFNKFPDCKCDYRSLKVGDFTWIARHKTHTHLELVLPFVVERKRMDDLGASIKDGRFHEQKFRLRKCGVNNVIYLVENYGKNKNVGLPLQSLMQALANTRVQDGFQVHETQSLANSVRFLAMMTKRLIIRFKDKHLKGTNINPSGETLMTFEYFNKSSVKNKALTVTETFIKQLLQLKGMSLEKALAITRKYPTPRSLIKAYLKCDVKEGQSLLAFLKYNELSSYVGPVISKSMYQFFTTNE